MSDRGQVEATSPKVRCAISNGSKLHLFGDGRSAGARRFRDLTKEFGAELGGFETLPATAQQTVRRLAQVSVELELLEAERASGEAIDPVTFVSLVNSQRRLLRDLAALRDGLGSGHPAPKQCANGIHGRPASSAASAAA